MRVTAMKLCTQIQPQRWLLGILYFASYFLTLNAYNINVLGVNILGTSLFNASLGNEWNYVLDGIRSRGTGLNVLLQKNGFISVKNVPNCDNEIENPLTVYIEARTKSKINTNFTIIPLSVHLKLEKCYNRHRRKVFIPKTVPNTQYIGVHLKTDFASCLKTQSKVLNVHHFIPDFLQHCVHSFSMPAFSDHGFVVEQNTGSVKTIKTVCLQHRPYIYVDVLIESHCENRTSTHQQVKIVLFGPQQQSSFSFADPPVVKHIKRMRRSTSNTRPRFDSYSYTKYVPEEENAGYIVDTITASDPDSGQGGILTYSLFATKDERSQTMFEISSSSGQIITKAKLDRENMARHHFQIVAIDNGSPRRSATTSLLIIVRDTNDHAPVFESDVYAKEISESISVSSPVETVRASDGDIGENRDIKYSLLNPQAPNDAFRINPHTGSITTRLRLDRETQDSYTLLVKAEDQGPVKERKSSTTTVQITIKDENDNRPQFSKKHYVFSVEENINVQHHPVIAEIKATDADAGLNGVVKYSITGGNTYGTFSIDPKSGQLSVMQKLDYEQRQVYTLSIRAQDEGSPRRSNITSVTISLVDVNDNEPRFYTSIYPESVPENVPIGHTIMKVQAHDGDSGKNADLDYSIVEGPENMPIGVQKKSGLVVTTAKLDREVSPRYTFKVQAKDNGTPAKSTFATVDVTVRDINDNAPIFNPRVYEVVVSEEDPPSTPVVTVQATDADEKENARITYSITSGNIRGAFNIISQTGQGLISLGRQLNYKEQSRYILTVTATDAGGMHDTANVIVNITDANTYPPQFVDAPYSHRVAEDTPVGSSVFQVSAADHDVGENARIVYEMAQNEGFQINPNTGVVTVKNELDREKQAVFTLSVEATDHGRPRKSDTTDIEFTILDVNDNSPIFSKSSYRGEIPEENESPVGTAVVRIAATDRDEGKNGMVWYTFAGGDNGDGHFNIEPISGVIRVAKLVDREVKSSYDLVAYASDRGNDARSSSVMIHVKIQDINDEEPKFESDKIVLKINENSPIGATVGKIEATDNDEGDNALVNYAIFGGPDEHLFKLTHQKGQPAVLTTLTELDYESGKRTYSVTVHARSDHLFSEAVVIIEVNDVNDNLPVLKNFVIVFNNFKHHFPSGPIGKVPASDPDVDDDLHFQFLSGNQASFLHLDSKSGLIRLDPGLDTGDFTTDAKLEVAVSDGLNVVRATCRLHVRQVTDDMLFNSITVRLNDIDEKTFLSSLYNRFVKAVASIIPTTEDNVVAFNIQDDTDVPNKILNVSFSVRQKKEPSKDVFFSPQFLRERVYLQRTQLATISTCQVLPFDDNLCVSEPCLNFENCLSILKFGNASNFLSSESMLFRPIRPINAFSCICPSDFTGSDPDYMCDVEVNFCHSNPCRHNGTCIQREGGYNCKCAPRYTGDHCQFDMASKKERHCPGNVCKLPGHCVPLIKGGFRCEKCPEDDHTSAYCRDCKELDNHSPLCELTTRSFKNGSYLTFPSLKRRHRFQIKLGFATQKKNGLLLYNGRYNEQHDFIALEVAEGQIQFSFSLGANITKIATKLPKAVNDGNWHQVQIDYFNKTVMLSVGKTCDVGFEVRYGMKINNHSCAVRATQVLHPICRDMSEPCYRLLDLTGPLQLGGLPNPAMQYQVENQYYEGCIRNVHIDEKLLDLHDYVGIKGTSEGCAPKNQFCKGKPCKNEGVCSEAWDTFQCECKEGFGGIDCTQTIEGPMQLGGGSNINYMKHGLASIDLPWYNSMAFRTRAEKGLLMYIKANQTHGDQKINIKIQLEAGYIHYSHEQADVTLDVIKVNDGRWHYLEVRWMERILYILLDYGLIMKEVPMSNFVKDLYIREIMVGGLKRMVGTAPVILDGLTGCVQDIRVGNFPTSVPKNPEGYEVKAGCEDSETCDAVKCPPHSVCEQDWQSHRCKCYKGYIGDTCKAVCAAYNPCAPGSQCITDPYDPRGYDCKCGKHQYGRYCEKNYTQPCPSGWVGYPICGPCNCTVERGFDKKCHGHPNNCTCKENYYLSTNDMNQPTCFPCNCYSIGSDSRTCDRSTGQCSCRKGVIGRQCDLCGSRFAEVTPRGCELMYDECPRHYAEGMWWERTDYGDSALQPCPVGSVGEATRACIPKEGWRKPDMFNCTSTAFINIKMKMYLAENGEFNVSTSARSKNLLKQLEEATRKTEKLHGTDILAAQEMIKHILVYETHQSGLGMSHTKDRTYMQNLVRTVGRILEPEYKESWEIINERTTGIVGLMTAVDLYTKNLAQNVPGLFTDKFDVGHKNLVLGIDKISKHNITDTNTPTKLKSRTLFGRVPHVTVPRQSLLRFYNEAVVSYVMYNTLGDLMPDQFDSSQIRVRKNVPMVINAPVFTLNLMDGSAPVSEASSPDAPFKFQFPLLETKGRSNPRCVFWKNNEGGSGGEWSTDGCELTEGKEDTSDVRFCSCSHLSTFTVLMDVAPAAVKRTPLISVQVMTYIGLCTCMIFLIISFFTLFVCKRLQSNSNSIHLSVIFVLFVAHIFYLVGIYKTEPIIVCKIIAIGLQYCYMATFAWMFVDVLHSFRMLTEIRDINHGSMVFYYVLGYAIPGTIVSLAVGLQTDGYGNEEFCWLRLHDILIISFVGPICVAIVLTFIVFLMALCACRRAKKPDRDLDYIKSNLASALILLPVLALCWTFGMLAVDMNIEWFHYLFALLTASQGVIIFFAYVVFSRRVRRQLKRAWLHLQGKGKDFDDSFNDSRDLSRSALAYHHNDSSLDGGLNRMNMGVSTTSTTSRSTKSSGGYRAGHGNSSTTTSGNIPSDMIYPPTAEVPPYTFAKSPYYSPRVKGHGGEAEPLFYPDTGECRRHRHHGDTDTESEMSAGVLEAASSHSSDEEDYAPYTPSWKGMGKNKPPDQRKKVQAVTPTQPQGPVHSTPSREPPPYGHLIKPWPGESLNSPGGSRTPGSDSEIRYPRQVRISEVRPSSAKTRQVSPVYASPTSPLGKIMPPERVDSLPSQHGSKDKIEIPVLTHNGSVTSDDHETTV